MRVCVWLMAFSLCFLKPRATSSAMAGELSDSPLLGPAERSDSELASVPDIASADESELAEVVAASSDDSSLAASGAAHGANGAASDSDESVLGGAGAVHPAERRGPGRPAGGGAARGRGCARSRKGRGGRHGASELPLVSGGPGAGPPSLSLDCVEPTEVGALRDFFRADSDGIMSEVLSTLSGPVTISESLRKGVENLTHLTFGVLNRNVATFGAEARLCGINRRSFPALLTAFCALTFFVFLMVTEAAARWLISAILAGDFELLAAFVFVSNDETSMYMSVPTDISPELLAAFKKVESKYKHREQYARYLCRIMNIVCRCSFLLKSRAGEEHIFVLELPEHLFNLDHNTTETTAETWRRLRQNFPTVFRLVGMALRVVYLMVNDNGVQNLRWYAKQLRDETNAGWLRSQCDVHQGHSAMGAALDTVKGIFSGITNTSLAMASSNSLEVLRRGIRILGRVRIKVVKCSVVPPLSPGAQRYRVAIIQSFLRPAIHGVSALVRAFVLIVLLNGDWRQEEVLYHYCVEGCCVGISFNDVFDQLIVDSLVSCLCPTCRRGRWMGTLHPVDWMGILFGIHAIGSLVIPPWCRELNDSSKPINEEDFKLKDASLASALHIEDKDPLPALLDEDVESIMLSLEESSAQAGKDSPDLNVLHRMQAKAFAEMRPAPWLLMIRTGMIPFLDLMQSLMRMAGKKFDHEQGIAAKDNKEIKYRLLEMARGVITNAFFKSVSGFLYGGWFWSKLPYGYRHERMSATAFRFIIRGAAAVFWHIHFVRTKRFPSKLFLLADGEASAEVVDDITSSRPCTWDDFTAVFFSWFKTRAERLSRPAITLLLIILWLMRNETVIIEDLHASLRRYIFRAVQCKKRSFEQILGDYCVMRLRLRFKDVFDERKLKTVCQKQRRKPRTSKRKKALSTTQHAIYQRQRRAARKADKPLKKKPVVSVWNVFVGQRRAGAVGPMGKREVAEIKKDFDALDGHSRAALSCEARRQTLKRRAVAFLKSQDSGNKRRRMRVSVDWKSDALVVVPEATYKQAAVYLNNACTSDLRNAIGRARQIADVAFRRRKQIIVAEHDALVAWKRRAVAFTLPGRLASLTSTNFLRCTSSFPSALFNPDMVPLAKHLFERLPAEVRDIKVIDEWKKFCRMIKHAECEATGELKKTKAQNWCCVAGRCLCESGPDPYLLRIQQSFGRSLRKGSPPKSAMRSHLSSGNLVARILSSDFATRWLHISFINLVTYVNVFLGMALLPDEVRQASVKPCRLLMVKERPLAFLTCWDGLDNLSHMLDHHLELWRIQDGVIEHEDVEIPVIRVALVLESVQFWEGPKLAAGGPPPIAPSAPGGDEDAPKFPPGPSGPAPLPAIEECPVEHDAIDGPDCPVCKVDEILKDVHMLLPDPIMEADEPLPGPTDDDAPKGKGPDGSDDAAKGKGPKGKGKKGRGPHNFGSLAALQAAKKLWLHPRDKSTDAISDPVQDFVSGAHRGRLYR